MAVESLIVSALATVAAWTVAAVLLVGAAYWIATAPRLP